METSKSTSKRRRKASQENGRKGGVKTELGKLVSSKNALKHGLLSNSISQYDSIDSSALFAELAVEFDVQTTYQNILLEQLVLTYIKLLRCNRFEKEIMNEELTTSESVDEILANLDRITPETVKALLNEQFFKRMELVLTRYEPQLTKRLTSLIETLRRFQKERAA